MSDAPDPRLLVAVGLGGALGSLGRYAVDLALPSSAGTFPWATLTVNLTGAVGIGVLVAWLVARPGTHRLARPFLGVGVLGGWTTFSAFTRDLLVLWQTGYGALATAYAALSVVGGVAAVGVGVLAGRNLWRPGLDDVEIRP